MESIRYNLLTLERLRKALGDTITLTDEEVLSMTDENILEQYLRLLDNKGDCEDRNEGALQIQPNGMRSLIKGELVTIFPPRVLYHSYRGRLNCIMDAEGLTVTHYH